VTGDVRGPSVWPHAGPSWQSGGVGRLCVPCASGSSGSRLAVARKVEAACGVVDASFPAARLVFLLTSRAPPDRSIDLERSAPAGEEVGGRGYKEKREWPKKWTGEKDEGTKGG
jgi:hypothetical protein